MFGRSAASSVNFTRVFREFDRFVRFSFERGFVRIWPGKSDVDQLYLIRKTLGEDRWCIERTTSFFSSGNLIDKHVIILKNNPHYKNVHIPEPDVIEPLEQKFPYVSERSLDFMKVRRIPR